MSMLMHMSGPEVKTPHLRIWRFLPGALLTSVAAALATEVVAWLVVGFGIHSSFAPLSPGGTGPAAFGAGLLATAVFILVDRFFEHRVRTFLWTSAGALVVSFIPIAVLALNPGFMPGTSALAIGGLLLVHLVAWGVIVLGLVGTERAMEEGL